MSNIAPMGAFGRDADDLGPPFSADQEISDSLYGGEHFKRVISYGHTGYASHRGQIKRTLYLNPNDRNI